MAHAASMAGAAGGGGRGAGQGQVQQAGRRNGVESGADLAPARGQTIEMVAGGGGGQRGPLLFRGAIRACRKGGQGSSVRSHWTKLHSVETRSELQRAKLHRSFKEPSFKVKSHRAKLHKAQARCIKPNAQIAQSQVHRAKCIEPGAQSQVH